MRDLVKIQPRYIDTKMAACYLSLSHKTLEKYRICGGGPSFAKFGNKIVYKIDDLEKWVAVRTYGSTAEYTLANTSVRWK